LAKFKTESLTPTTLQIVENKGTEHPFTGDYNDLDLPGSYLCRKCGLTLFRSKTKFHSGCGWPSFDENISDAVIQRPDSDGKRVEIICGRCEAHLGHVFHGENMTVKDTRHCVNSNSLDFVADMDVLDTEEAIFAAGCFWGVEYYFKQLSGVLKVEVGYSGGSQINPTYEDICSGRSGHYEVIRVVYDIKKINFEKIAQYFFEIHDFTQENGQGPDLGQQYLSVAFYYNERQQNVATGLIKKLTQMGYRPATRLLPVSTFWPAEGYHQDYYRKTGKQPYCHHYQKIFE
jgi:peptide methionine sulfoxide reductase msrA/msrB